MGRVYGRLVWIIPAGLGLAAATGLVAVFIIIPTTQRLPELSSGPASLPPTPTPVVAQLAAIPATTPNPTPTPQQVRLKDFGITYRPPADRRYDGSAGSGIIMGAPGIESGWHEQGKQVIQFVLAGPGGYGHVLGGGYSGEPLNLTEPVAQLKVVIERNMGPMANLQRTTVGGRPAVSFYHVEYNWWNATDMWVTKSYLIPHPNPPYTNLLVTGPALQRAPINLSDRAALLGQYGREHPNDASLALDTERQFRLFETTVKTITFAAETKLP